MSLDTKALRALLEKATPGPWDSRVKRNDRFGTFEYGTEVLTLNWCSGHATYEEAYNDPKQKVQPFVVCRAPSGELLMTDGLMRVYTSDMAFIAAIRNAASELLDAAEERDLLREVLNNIIQNGRLAADPFLSGYTDCYVCTTDDVEAARAALRRNEDKP